GAAPAGPGRRRSLEGLLDLLRLEGLEDVADLDVLIALEHEPALEALLDLAHVVLEAAERGDTAGPHDGAVAHEADLRPPRDLAVSDQAPGDDADAGGAEQLLHLGLAERLLDLLRCQHALHR